MISITVYSTRMWSSLMSAKLVICVRPYLLTKQYIVSRIGSDIAVIQEGLSTNVSMFLRSFIFILVSFIFLFILSWELTLLMLGSIAPVIIFSVFYGKMMKNTQKTV